MSELYIVDGGRDKKYHLSRHGVKSEHCNASYDDFQIIGGGFGNNIFKRKVANQGITTNFEHSGEVDWVKTL